MEIIFEECKILIVDDAAENIDYIGGILKNYKKSIATTGKKALEKIQSESPPDLILLDILLPDMNGLEICRIIKQNEKTRDIPVIFVTAKSDPEDEIAGFDAGASDYIVKPFYPRGFISRINNILKIKKIEEYICLNSINKNLVCLKIE